MGPIYKPISKGMAKAVSEPAEYSGNRIGGAIPIAGGHSVDGQQPVGCDKALPATAGRTFRPGIVRGNPPYNRNRYGGTPGGTQHTRTEKPPKAKNPAKLNVLRGSAETFAPLRERGMGAEGLEPPTPSV